MARVRFKRDQRARTLVFHLSLIHCAADSLALERAIHHVALTVNHWGRSRECYLELSETLGCKPIIDVQGSANESSTPLRLNSNSFTCVTANNAEKSLCFCVKHSGCDHRSEMAL